MKIKEFIKKYDNIFILIIILTVSIGFSFCIQLGANDELWNFSNIYKMNNGYTIYKDLNVIITPLFFYIGKFLFSIFGATYFTYRIYAISLIYTGLYFAIYQLLKKIKINKINAMLFTIILLFINLLILLDGSYNTLAITFVIVGLIYSIKNKNTLFSNIIQGLIVFLVFISKQNIGVYYFLGLIIYQLLIYKKKSIKNILVQGITFIVLFLGYLTYLKINGNLYNFINYAFLGIGEFANRNIKINISGIVFIISEIIILVTIIYLIYTNKIKFKNEEKNISILLGTVSISMCLIAFPIINIAHVLLASITFFIFIFYLLDRMILNDILSSKKIISIKKAIIILLVIIGICINIYFNIPYILEITKANYYFKNSPYYGSIATTETLDEIEEICNYIKEQNKQGTEVKIISYYSNLYMNILNKNNGKMDLPFYGNLGKEGEKGLIFEINNLQNTKILILKEEDNLYQESKKVTDYIRKNLEYEMEINRFYIYKSK